MTRWSRRSLMDHSTVIVPSEPATLRSDREAARDRHRAPVEAPDAVVERQEALRDAVPGGCPRERLAHRRPNAAVGLEGDSDRARSGRAAVFLAGLQAAHHAIDLQV